MTEAEAKSLTMAVLRSQRENVIVHIINHLLDTLPDEVSRYLTFSGNLAVTRTATSIKCELQNLLENSGMDPEPLIVKRQAKRRIRVAYKGLYMHEYIRRKRPWFNLMAMRRNWGVN